MRSRLIAASEKLFLNKGLIGTSVDAIVSAAKTSKREFYKYFSSREEIFVEVARKSLLAPYEQMENVNQIKDDFPREKEDEESPQDFLFRSAKFMYDKHLDTQNLGLFRAAIEASLLHPGLSQAVYEARSHSFLESYLQERKQEFGFTYDNAHLAAIRFGHLAIDGLQFMVGGSLPTPEQRRQLARDATEIFLNGHAASRFRTLEATLPHPVDHSQWRETSPIIDLPTDTRLPPSAWEGVLKLAWDAFGKLGYDKTSLAAVAQQANVSRNTLYRQYGSKENLFIASAGMVIEETFGHPIAIENTKKPIKNIMMDTARNLLVRFLSPLNLQLHRHLLIEAGRNPVMTSRIYSHLIDCINNLLNPLFDNIITNEIIKKDLSQKASWRFFILATLGTRFLFTPPKSLEEHHALSEEAVDLFLYGSRRDDVMGVHPIPK